MKILLLYWDMGSGQKSKSVSRCFESREGKAMGDGQETRDIPERLPWGGERRSSNFKASRAAMKGKTAARIAASLGVSQATIERIHAVADSDQEDIKAKLVSGELTPYAAYRLLRQAKWEQRMRAEAAQ